MKIFVHHIYEYKKGLRKLVLYTGPASEKERIIDKLEKHEISYIVDDVSSEKINVFFGAGECINVLRNFQTLELDKLSDTEDFILGAMLGYDLIIQCRRFVKRKNGAARKNNLIKKEQHDQNKTVACNYKTKINHLEKDLQEKDFIIRKNEYDLKTIKNRIEEYEINEMILKEEISRLEFENCSVEGFEYDDECSCFEQNNCEYKNRIDSIKSSVDLSSKTVLLVGGRKKLKEYCREIVESGNGLFVHHDGGLEDSKKKLSSTALKADIVICALDCISHSACKSMKKICKKENKNILYLKNTAVSTLSEQIKAVC